MLDCYHIPGFRKRIETRGRVNKDTGVLETGVVSIIASEGDTIELPGSISKDVTVPGQGLQRQIEDAIIPTVIQKFPRPGQKGNLPGQKIAAEEMERVRAERRANAPARLLGVEDDDAEAAIEG